MDGPFHHRVRPADLEVSKGLKLKSVDTLIKCKEQKKPKGKVNKVNVFKEFTRIVINSTSFWF